MKKFINKYNDIIFYGGCGVCVFGLILLMILVMLPFSTTHGIHKDICNILINISGLSLVGGFGVIGLLEL